MQNQQSVPEVMQKNRWLAGLWVLFSLIQTGASQKVLSEKDFLDWVLRYHPVSYQASLTASIAEREVGAARGLFDPVLSSSWNNKRYDAKEYWRVFHSEVKAPILFGPDVKMGYERAEGIFLNDENTLPAAGLVYLGLSVPLGKDLITDERRTALRMAQNFKNMGLAEQETLLNDLFFDAVKAYWEWALAYANRELFSQFVTLADIRFQAVKRGYLKGLYAAIDTVEALILLQTRQNSLQEALQEYVNATLKLSNFLWDEFGRPVLLPDTLIPVRLGPELQVPVINQAQALRFLEALQEHPELRIKRFKVRELQLYQRLKFNYLLPDLRFQYNFLAEPIGTNPVHWNFSPFRNNFKYGASLKFPLLIRTARARYDVARFKTRQGLYDVDLKELELRLKLRQTFNNLEQTALQAVIHQNMVENYRRLNQAEQAKFEIGESSVFLINQREIKLIESLQKVNELKAKGRRFFAETYYRVGTPWVGYAPYTGP